MTVDPVYDIPKGEKRRVVLVKVDGSEAENKAIDTSIHQPVDVHGLITRHGPGVCFANIVPALGAPFELRANIEPLLVAVAEARRRQVEISVRHDPTVGCRGSVFPKGSIYLCQLPLERDGLHVVEVVLEGRIGTPIDALEMEPVENVDALALKNIARETDQPVEYAARVVRRAPVRAPKVQPDEADVSALDAKLDNLFE